jgi:hypothetical protein
MPKASVPVRIALPFYWWIQSKMEKDDDGKAKESFDDALQRLTGYKQIKNGDSPNGG